MTEPLESVRLDKWLWAARVFKTRGLAAEACDGGKVDVNAQAAKPARPLRRGEVVRVTLPQGRHRVLKVLQPGDRRGSATVARALFEDLTPPEPPRTRLAPPPRREPGMGRPTKRDRRELDRLRNA